MQSGLTGVQLNKNPAETELRTSFVTFVSFVPSW
jgi:hypothetical protein